ncbi:cupin domain-containing protein [Ureibacillus sp. MALMAid1270]|uniref:cupin domain-containing protein n=1 Tax=Ureibacillus sp. MALMAid1270 TaxID=3411629 RepID=UPI003BA50F2E
MEIIETPYILGEKNKKAGKVFTQDQFDVMNIQLKTGEEIPAHHSDRDVIIIVRNGIVAFTVEEKTVELTNEQLLYIKPFEKHSIVAKEDADIIVMKIKNESLNDQ